ncbi:MAG: sugar phosphate isomerase/epimerase [Chitinophagaceae bacterium]|nr:sugar phosphate isomerase/epimerase [Chitinophagaceae bacterium]
MKKISRRDFIQYSGTFLAATTLDKNMLAKQPLPKLSFSTLGCPDWPLDKILEVAVANNYSAVEIRGILREMDLSKSPAFNSDANIKATKQKFKDKNLEIVGLGSSAAMHHAGEAERSKAMDEAKRFIEVAGKVGASYVRVFPNNFPKEVSKEKSMELMTSGLNDLAKFSKGASVKVVMETHGDLIRADDIAAVMNNVDDRQIGLVWDISNMWTVTREDIGSVYDKLKKWIWHTHLKDIKIDGDKQQYTLFGEGDVPAFNAIDLLVKNNYKGYYGFEWEKMWHPEIAEPEVAIPQFAQAMKKHFS